LLPPPRRALQAPPTDIQHGLRGCWRPQILQQQSPQQAWRRRQGGFWWWQYCRLGPAPSQRHAAAAGRRPSDCHRGSALAHRLQPLDGEHLDVARGSPSSAGAYPGAFATAGATVSSPRLAAAACCS
jgi:hypothetical protein